MFVCAGVHAVSKCYLRTNQPVTDISNVHSSASLVNALRMPTGTTSSMPCGIDRKKSETVLAQAVTLCHYVNLSPDCLRSVLSHFIG